MNLINDIKIGRKPIHLLTIPMLAIRRLQCLDQMRREAETTRL
jgi:hypothetical protein